ncbi:hypothetical protein, unlikely [Trypanosoma brucei gambiense DAL972]|uniref:Uncharacterized protein n=1 Tax=Trypanosoma brucei gambiense (strain MHOM/CI/86/DAL972) TaxID=679716 RepID=D0A908_TRYB9|nr:hypothetical protein, unlikely [Trypanosoma brucei gambiense DAL972]CBH18159.1 hypothetical protein, unlikely [Trypanosoma brucei gambiense DAL972]|eukprot:XP_011780423.1 hypothetical protein, unlikely [Trypanosoma brucei gambiense DAL972]
MLLWACFGANSSCFRPFRRFKGVFMTLGPLSRMYGITKEPPAFLISVTVPPCSQATASDGGGPAALCWDTTLFSCPPPGFPHHTRRYVVGDSYFLAVAASGARYAEGKLQEGWRS